MKKYLIMLAAGMIAAVSCEKGFYEIYSGYISG